MNTRAVLFDLDGTLADTREDIALSVNYIRGLYNLPPLPVEEIASFIGSGVRALLERALNGQRPLGMDSLILKFRDHYMEHCLDATYLYPGILRLVMSLHDHGIKMAVTTNKPVAHSIKILGGLQIASYFQKVLGGDSVARKKPDPEMLVQAMSALSALPAETVLVGDSDVDVQSARAARIRVVGVTYGIGEWDESTKPDEVIDSPLELIDYLNGVS